MAHEYSVFLQNVGSCFDRYTESYGPDYTTRQLVERAASIERIKGLDLVATPGLLAEIDDLKKSVAEYGLSIVSIAADIFSEERWKQGSFSSRNEKIRQAAIDHARAVMDLTAELGSSLLTLWPGQDGYDYIFQADYIAERELFMDAVRRLCEHNPQMQVGLEYKPKEPRTHSYVNYVGTTILMAQAIGANCGVVLDYGHALLGYESPSESVAILKQFGDRLLHVHINDNYRSWDDDMIVGSVHLAEFLEFFFWLRRTGYDGWITIDQYPYREDGKEAVEESTLWLDRLETIVDAADADQIERTLAAKDAVKASRLLRSLILP